MYGLSNNAMESAPDTVLISLGVNEVKVLRMVY
jgi:hypothetical protein